MKRIMVVDDLPDQIFTIKQTLENLDDEYEIIGAESGEQCLELLNNGEVPDLILSETRMPGMTGRELLDRLKENPTWKDIPIFFLTAWEDKFVKNSIGNLGDGHIEKPFDMRNLKERIDTFLKKQ
jgi:CheY-like chemotaxis protein